mmetsp:Transcript_19997/g.39286  ORF Transcript_19997/g.39286 Transcript_19997/m.39286 type:complete len:483 (+) Transcript_19997:81-1529(+)|eukprot:CAMPEP_0171542492 /NCGR_PEP_ID=MMETSP0960-20121227/2391_1 /TAXON_ID=87120 /ORGANISM="Aurantiochytrium limacinum, Strain ATCCMYA-1381" /LENGTH=482 /DNA_ID=CAMNT_0012090027 /DNA_START=61 /DNA_END=1509 /DNA_ORIENTATION=+
MVSRPGGSAEALRASVSGPGSIVEPVAHVFVFGRGHWGQLGLGSDESFPGSPQLVQCLLGEDVASVGAGYNHTLVATRSGDLYAWGHGGCGKLGLGKCTHEPKPVRVPMSFTPRQHFAHVACGDLHSLAVSLQGRVFAWGSNLRGQLGKTGVSHILSPTLVESGELSKALAVRQVYAGHSYSACTDATGNLYMWGSGEAGELGSGHFQDSSTPTQVSSLPGPIVTASAGRFHFVCVVACKPSPRAASSSTTKMSEQVYTWGCGTGGQLGHGDLASVCAPKCVDFFQDLQPSHVAAGAQHTLIAASQMPGIYSSSSSAATAVYVMGTVFEDIDSSDQQRKQCTTVPLEVEATRGLRIQHLASAAFRVVLSSDDGRVVWWGMPSSRTQPTTIARLHCQRVVGIYAGGGDHVCFRIDEAWLQHAEVTRCMECQQEFSMAQFKHACVRCAKVVHSSCSSHRCLIPEIATRPVRVCDSCFRSLQEGR